VLQKPKERTKTRHRRFPDIEKKLLDHTIIRARVQSDEVSLFLNSGAVIKFSLRSTDEGPLNFSWSSFDTIKTDGDFKS